MSALNVHFPAAIAGNILDYAWSSTSSAMQLLEKLLMNLLKHNCSIFRDWLNYVNVNDIDFDHDIKDEKWVHDQFVIQGWGCDKLDVKKTYEWLFDPDRSWEEVHRLLNVFAKFDENVWAYIRFIEEGETISVQNILTIEDLYHEWLDARKCNQ
jgi:hypothetical protein